MTRATRNRTAHSEMNAQRPGLAARLAKAAVATRKAAKRAFATAALLTSFAGCGDEIRNNYYFAPDGGAKPQECPALADAAVDANVADSAPDARLCGVASSDRCEKKSNRASCFLRQNEFVELDGLNFTFFSEKNATSKFAIFDPKAGCGDNPADALAAFKLQSKDSGAWIQSYFGFATVHGRTYLLSVTGVYPDATSTYVSAVRAEIMRIDGNVTCESLLSFASPVLKQGQSFSLSSHPLISTMRLNDVSSSGDVSVDLLGNTGGIVQHMVMPGDSMSGFKVGDVKTVVGASDVFAGLNEQSARVTLYNCQ